MRRAFANRVDATSKELRAYAESIGFVVVPINGVIDCLLCWGSKVIPVDWKSRTAPMTPAQQKLVLQNVPVRFCSTPAHVDQLKAELSR